MALDLQGVVGGLQAYAAGAARQFGIGRDGGALVTQLTPRWYELARAGRVFLGGTAATGVAPGTAIGTTAAFALYNPQGSGKNLVLLKASLGYVSGTLGAGVIHLCAHKLPSQAAFSGTAIVLVNALMGAGESPVGLAYTTATVPASPTVMRPLFSLGASLASTAVQPWMCEAEFDGEILIPPGCGLSIQATAAAGTSPLVVFGSVHAELPA